MMRSAWTAAGLGLVAAWAITAPATLGQAGAAARALTPLAHVETVGTGPVHLVLVPSPLCDWTIWRAFMERNAERYTMHAVTLPGAVGTQPPPAPPPIAQPKRGETLPPQAYAGTPWLDNAVAALEAMIREKGLTEPVVVGHSMGGHIALRLAADHPGLVGKVATIDGLPTTPMRLPQGVRREMAVETRMAPAMRQTPDAAWEQQQRAQAAQMVTDPARGQALGDLISRTPKAVGVQYTAEALKSDLARRIEEITIPVLAVAAIPRPEDSPNVPLQERRDLWIEQVSLAPQDQVVFFEETRHFVMDDQPEAFDAAIEAFIAGRNVRGVDAGAAPAKDKDAPQP